MPPAASGSGEISLIYWLQLGVVSKIQTTHALGLKTNKVIQVCYFVICIHTRIVIIGLSAIDSEFKFSPKIDF